MKISLCQINPTVGAIDRNVDLIMKWYQKAVAAGAELTVFPELVLVGYPPQDLLLRRRFINKAEMALKSIAEKTTVPMIIGNPLRENGELYNCAFVCSNGEITGHYKKRLLPTYDVFDEDRYFTSGESMEVIEVRFGDSLVKIGMQICEDLWDEDYACNLAKSLKEKGAECIVNISASPYRVGRLADRSKLIVSKVTETALPFFYCNIVGAQDELIFDGQSLAYDGKGNLIGQGSAFEEDIVLVDLENPAPIQLKTAGREQKMYHALVLGVRDYFRKTGYKKAVLGLSGGIDSSITGCIAVDALGPNNVHGVSMPSRYSSDHSRNDAKTLAKNLGIDYRTISIESIIGEFDESLEESFNGSETGVAEENIQARVRGSLLMALSNKFNWLVLSTGNKTELAMGCLLYTSPSPRD